MPNESEYADARLAMPKKTTQNISMVLRPYLSASGPKISAPAVNPNSPAPNTGVRATGLRCHSPRIAGAMNPMAAVSKPSTATIRKQSSNVSICVHDNLCALMNSCTSISKLFVILFNFCLHDFSGFDTFRFRHGLQFFPEPSARKKNKRA